MQKNTRWGSLLILVVWLASLLVSCSMPLPSVSTPPAQPNAGQAPVGSEAGGADTTAGQTEGIVTPPAGGEPATGTTPASPPPASQPPGNQTFLPNIASGGREGEDPNVGGGQESGSGQEPPAGGTPPQPARTSRPQPELAYIKNGDLWITAFPGGTPLQVTRLGNILSFTWSWDGELLASFDGRQVCLWRPDGSVPGSRPCNDLGLNETQAKLERRIAWGPNPQQIVVWNPTNPGDEGALGWIVITLGAPAIIQMIEDPVDWGLAAAPDNEPGGITGQPLFLPDGTLLGTFTHRYLCGSGGCSYLFYRFNPDGPGLVPLQSDPQQASQQGLHLALSYQGNTLANYGIYQAGAENFTSYVHISPLDPQQRQTLELPQEAIRSLALSPDGRLAVAALASGGENAPTSDWHIQCGLANDVMVGPLQLWNLDPNNPARASLLPGITPEWSPDGQWVAFRSCLVQDAGAWQPTPGGPANIYVMDPSGSQVTLVDQGTNPSWRP